MVEVAASGEMACALLENYTPDAILLDLNLPGINGYSVLTWMKTNRVRCTHGGDRLALPMYSN